MLEALKAFLATFYFGSRFMAVSHHRYLRTRIESGSKLIRRIGIMAWLALTVPALLPVSAIPETGSLFSLPTLWIYSLFLLPIIVALIVAKTHDLAERKKR